MSNRYRLYLLVLIAVGLVISLITTTDWCTFGACTEVHKYHLFGISFTPIGIAFFILAGVFVLLVNRLPGARLFFNLLLAGACGAEINMILLQKNIIGAWCPLCISAAVIVFILTLSQLVRYFLSFREEFQMNFRNFGKLLLLLATFLVGFSLTFTGMAKVEEASASQLNLYMGKQESKLEIYFFSDWLCPFCAKADGVVESVYPTLAQKAKILFVDKIIHQEALNFVPYDLSFAAYEKAKYMQLRKALFGVAQRTRNPSYDDIKAAITPLKVTYRQLSFLDVTQQMANFQKLSEQFRVTSTPTMVIHNSKTNKTKTLIGDAQLTPEQIMKTVKELE
ncbi:MAG TPA: thioredoxin domain-containing protein [Geobacteraceae bacterium]|nr:thioredoxin domain-containing protein [Geobacteraceae bacterium]